MHNIGIIAVQQNNKNVLIILSEIRKLCSVNQLSFVTLFYLYWFSIFVD